MKRGGDLTRLDQQRHAALDRGDIDVSVFLCASRSMDKSLATVRAECTLLKASSALSAWRGVSPLETTRRQPRNLCCLSCRHSANALRCRAWSDAMQMIDTTHIKAHRFGFGRKRGKQKRAIGRSRTEAPKFTHRRC